MALSSGSIQKSIGVSRVLTYEFKKLRKAAPPRMRFQLDMDISSFRGNEKLLEGLENSDKIKPAFPPLWVDTYDKIIEDIGKLQEMIVSLETLQQKRIASPFASNTDMADKKIKLSSDAVYQMILIIDNQIKDLRNHNGNYEDLTIRNNIISGLSNKLKEFTLRFKKKQEIYLKKVKPNDLLGIESTEISFDLELAEENQIDKYKNEAIDSLVQNIIDLSEIFKELNTLVVSQGTIFDRIDYNIKAAMENSKKAHGELVKAEKSQKCTRSVGCILLLVGIILFLLIVLGFKIFLAV
jgi:syntaxin 16